MSDLINQVREESQPLIKAQPIPPPNIPPEAPSSPVDALLDEGDTETPPPPSVSRIGAGTAPGEFVPVSEPLPGLEQPALPERPQDLSIANPFAPEQYVKKIDADVQDASKQAVNGIDPDIYQPPQLYQGDNSGYLESLERTQQMLDRFQAGLARPSESFQPQALPPELTKGFMPSSQNSPFWGDNTPTEGEFNFNPLDPLGWFRLATNPNSVKFGEMGSGAVGGLMWGLNLPGAILQGAGQELARTGVALKEGFQDFGNFGAAFNRAMALSSPTQFGQAPGRVRVTGIQLADSWLTKLRNSSWVGRAILGGNQTAMDAREKDGVINPLGQMESRRFSNKSWVGDQIAGGIRNIGNAARSLGITQPIRAIAGKAGVQLPTSGELSKQAQETDWLGLGKGLVIDVISGEVIESALSAGIKGGGKLVKATAKPGEVVTQIQGATTRLQPPSGGAVSVVKAKPGTVISRPDVLAPPPSIRAPRPKVNELTPSGAGVPPARLDELKANLRIAQTEAAQKYKRTLPKDISGGNTATTLQHADTTLRLTDEAADLRVKEIEYQKITQVLKQAEATLPVRPNTLFDDVFTERLTPVSQAMPSVTLPRLDADTPFYHGTRVSGLDLKNADPIAGGAANEYGTALYFTRNKDEAIANALKQVPPNVPDSVMGRTFGEPRVQGVDIDLTGVRTANELVEPEILSEVKLDALTAVANMDADLYLDVERAISKLPDEVTYGKINSVIQDVLDTAYDGPAPEALRLEVGRAVTRRLRSAGVNGVYDGESVALFAGNRVTVRGELPVQSAPLDPNVVEAVNSFNAASIALTRNPESSALQDAFNGAKLQVLGAAQDAAQEARDAAKDALADRVVKLADVEDELLAQTKTAQQRELLDLARKQEAADEILTNETFTIRTKGERPCL